MKKILCTLLAISAIFCFAGCENDKCDICKKETEACKVYETLDNQELCPACAVAEGIKKGVDIATDK